MCVRHTLKNIATQRLGINNRRRFERRHPVSQIFQSNAFYSYVIQDKAFMLLPLKQPVGISQMDFSLCLDGSRD